MGLLDGLLSGLKNVFENGTLKPTRSGINLVGATVEDDADNDRLTVTITGTGTPTTRVITAGAGLTGGGDLSTDRTINVGAHADGSIAVAADTIQVGVLATDVQHGSRGGASLHAAATNAEAGFATAAHITMLETHEVQLGATRTVTLDLTDPDAADGTWTDVGAQLDLAVNTSAYYELAFVLRRRDTQDDATGTPYTAVRTYSGSLRVDATRGSGDVLVSLAPSEEGGTTVDIGAESGEGMAGAAQGETFRFQAVDTAGGWKLQVRPLSAGIEGPPFPAPGITYVSPEDDGLTVSTPVDASLLVTVATRASVTSAGELPETGTLVVV